MASEAIGFRLEGRPSVVVRESCGDSSADGTNRLEEINSFATGLAHASAALLAEYNFGWGLQEVIRQQDKSQRLKRERTTLGSDDSSILQSIKEQLEVGLLEEALSRSFWVGRVGDDYVEGVLVVV
jgi:hypothetical protein